MDKAEITNLQQQSVPNITERLPALDRASLIELAAQEAASAAPRTTLQTAIDKQLAVLDEDEDKSEDKDGDKKEPPAVDGATVEPATKAAGKIEKPEKIEKTDFRHPEYSGPLNGEQASWRVANIKPVEKVRTK